jgi:hypothetical protein
VTRYRIVSLAAPALLYSLGATAAASDQPTDPAAPATPSLTEVLAKSGVVVTGYISATYEDFSGQPTYREFDVDKNSFSLKQASLQVAYQPKDGFGGVVQLMAGDDASVINQAESSSASNFDVLQGYAQYSKGQWTLIGGKFLTLVGAEVIAPTGNTNISRSLTFFTEPLTHTGFRATYAASDQVSLIVGVNNGWNVVHDNNTSKTLEFGASLTPSKIWSFALQGYVGKEPVSSTQDGTRSIVDFVGTWNATDALTVVLNYDWGRQANLPVDDSSATASGSWTTGALYLNYTIAPTWRVSLRAELLDDKDGFQTGTIQKVKEGTVTLGWMPGKNFELRVEGRYDKSNQATFVKSVSVASAQATYRDDQSSVEVEGLFKF